MKDSILYEHSRQDLLNLAKDIINKLEAYSKMKYFISNVSVIDFSSMCGVEGYYLFYPSGNFNERSILPSNFSVKAEISIDYSYQKLEAEITHLRKDYKAVLRRILLLPKSG